ncbi:hypothetical protein EW964_06720 [Salmonella enterica subsp. enterica serovar Napoli]|nr:hypothetical protein [Salmonella enterica subsp. enterica serovar Napoli]
MESNEDESIEELELKVKYYNRKLYRIVIIGCLSQLIAFCLYSYFNDYKLVFIVIPLFIIAIISLVLFFFLRNEAMPVKIKHHNVANKYDPISEDDYKIMKIQDWMFISFFGMLVLYNVNAVFYIILLMG